MGNILYWIAASILFGLVAGGLYTWLSPRNSGRWAWLFVRSSFLYMLFALACVGILTLVAQS